jgi:hypothetical protein
MEKVTYAFSTKAIHPVRWVALLIPTEFGGFVSGALVTGTGTALFGCATTSDDQYKKQ